MRWCIIAGDDWGNTGYAYGRALQAVGEEVVGLKLNPHPWYEAQLPALQNQEAFAITAVTQARRSDVVIYIHSMTFPEQEDHLRHDLAGKKVLVHHGGTTYRQGHEEIDTFWSSLSSGLLIDTVDLYHLDQSSKPRLLLPTPIDTDFLSPVARPFHSHYTVGHFPSNPEVKGTPQILEAVQNLFVGDPLWNLDVRTTPCSWLAQVERLRGCSLYIDQLQPLQGEKEMGIHGIATREAASLGIPVITNQTRDAEYRQLLGEHPLLIANTPGELQATLSSLLSSPTTLTELSWKHREWATRVHSYKSAGERLLSFAQGLDPVMEKQV